MIFELPKLPYTLDSLEPAISQKTMEFHYGKHLQTYITNLNGLIKDSKFENADLEKIVRESDGPTFNNAAQAWNHEFYFKSFRPNAANEPHAPKGKLAEAISAKWGSFDNFKEEFVKLGTGIFGSGWAWLVKNQDGSIDIVKEGNAGNPMTSGKKPLLTFDVWEHAYYLDFQNRRADQLKALWAIIDWDVVDKRYL